MMRPATPNYNFAGGHAGQASPPQTPTTATAPDTFTFKSRRNGMHISASSLPEHHTNGSIKPTGNGSSFYYTPSTRPAADQLSPRSSSPDSDAHASESSGSPPRSLSSSPIPPLSEPLPQRTPVRIAEGNFTVEEFADSDYEDWDSEDDVIRPSQYEDAESDRAPSVKSITRNDLDSRMLSGFKNLQCVETDEEREIWLEKYRADKRRRRRSSASVQKRTLSQSIGSDTDDEDLKPVTFEGANEAGSSARRLRRKTLAGERTSLIFDDPPPRIDEEDEGPESVEEVVEIKDDDEDLDVDRELRELPYWYIQEMDVDSEE